jgi:hypothetical protein
VHWLQLVWFRPASSESVPASMKIMRMNFGFLHMMSRLRNINANFIGFSIVEVPVYRSRLQYQYIFSNPWFRVSTPKV